MAYRKNGRQWKQNASRRRLKEHRQGILLLAIALIIACGFAGLYLFAKNRHDSVDHQTFCKRGRIDEVSVVLIDQTDHFNDVQSTELKRELKFIARNIPKNSWLKLIAVSTDPSSLLKEESPFCNPGDENTTNNFIGNKKLAKDLYEKRYKSKIDEMLESILLANTQNSSPIMEAIQATSVTTFKNDDAPAVKKLIIVSDLLQHTNEFSMYREIPDFKDFKNLPYWNKINTDLEDVKVHVFVIRRDGADELQNTKLIKFWTDYFSAQGVTDFKSTPIDG